MMRLNIKRLSAPFRYGMACLFLVCAVSSASHAQENRVQLLTQSYYQTTERGVMLSPNIIHPPSSVALKINLLYAATLTPNLALEIGLGKRTTLDLGAGYNFFKPDNGKLWKHWLAQPEFRYWFCERFNGTFLGVHALGGEYNFAKIDLGALSVFDDLKDFRYEGYYYGGGIVLGHQWILGKRWNLEAAIGLGYARVHYDKYECGTCGASLGSGAKNYWGPTKASISFLFFL